MAHSRSVEADLELWVRQRRRFSARARAGTGGTFCDEEHVFGFVGGQDEEASAALYGLGPAGAERVLEHLRAGAVPGIVGLLGEPAAEHLDALRAEGWAHTESVTAMLHRDLGLLEVPPLPDGLTMHPGSPRPGDAPWERVVALYRADDPDWPVDDERLVAGVRRMLDNVFVLVDAGGEAVATSGTQVVDGGVRVASVVTAAAWRGRGVATAMTATGLAHAHRAGARFGVLEATDAGAGIYLRLGFRAVGRVHGYERKP